MSDEYYMKKALDNAKKAFDLDEVPIGAIIVKNNKILASTFNRKELDNIATYHAEVLAINEACKKLNTWHLEDCVLYTTVEPCLMCTGAIIQSRISRVVYGTKNDTFGYLSRINNMKIDITKNVLEKECKVILSSFFQKKRN
ncbi:MAG: nucleoside deaminase [Bacilli bacterium]|nr:nucleoside deaminase [Bacilli bacterium]